MENDLGETWVLGFRAWTELNDIQIVADFVKTVGDGSRCCAHIDRYLESHLVTRGAFRQPSVVGRQA